MKKEPTAEQSEKAALFFDHIEKAREAGKDWWATALERFICREIERDQTIAELLEALERVEAAYRRGEMIGCNDAALVGAVIAKAKGRADG